MLLTDKIPLSNWQSIWNRSLVSLYIFIYFLNGVTRFKHLLTLLMAITAVIYCYQLRAKILIVFKNNVSIAFLIFIISIVYSVLISVDIDISTKAAKKDIFEKIIIITLSMVIILHKETKEDIAKLLIYSLSASIIPMAIADGIQYYNEYKVGILPFTSFEHRYKSDAFIFMAIGLMGLWSLKRKYTAAAFCILLPILSILILGTLQRGTWLAVLIPGLVWIVLRKEWRLMLCVAIIVALPLGYVYLKNDQQFSTLFHKMQQTDSSERYGNGTQGAALDLILDKPIKGYGYGKELYLDVYAKNIEAHPQWFFQKPIGPHNLSLSMWFYGGIFGLISLWLLLLALVQKSVSQYVKNTGVTQIGWLTVFLIVLGDFLVRGMFETINLQHFSIVIGIAISMIIPKAIKK
ncbi:O-antigen ligase RfaL [Citrobacter koseri]|uniref:O-antigen ligase RfaL n=1 Tax=Citrobacter koseri TaxID=545 RepID=UPI0024B7C665|nr:O-antigen ligase RfaL [Citrobacter koseri]MDI9802666.1 O-antigen ligase RfaL [Citrobacter koseri]